MSDKKSFFPIASLGKNNPSAGQKKHIQLPFQLDEEIPISQDEEKNQTHRMKRLKKVMEPSDEEMFVNQNDGQNESQESEEKDLQYEKFRIADDDDLQREKEENQQKKKNKKMKGMQSLDKFLSDTPKQPKQPKASKIKKDNTPVSIAALMERSKIKKPKRVQVPFVEDEMKEEIDDHNFAYQARKKMQEVQHIEKPKVQFPSQQQGSIFHTNQEDQMIDEKNTASLDSLTFVLTGQFQPFNKVEVQNLLQKMGARCSRAVTTQTSFLIQGSYEINKWKKRICNHTENTKQTQQAKKMNIPIIRNCDIDSFLMQRIGNSLAQLLGKSKTHQENESSRKMIEIEQMYEKPLEVVKRQQMRVHENAQQVYKCQKKYREQEEMIEEKRIVKSDPVELWSEKYRPTELRQVIGQETQIKNLRNWLRDWEDVHVRGNKKEAREAYNSFRPAGNINSKAALLSGEAGLGKTTTARLLAKQYGYGVVEFNASDMRNKNSVEKMQNKDNMWLSAEKVKKTLIIMDEVDGMSSGDRGGITAIINSIKKSKNPIICICNDRDSQKIRSLAAHCYDIKFLKAEKKAIISRLKQIISKEKGTSNQKGLQRIVQMFQSDIRQIINYIEVFFRTYSTEISYNTIEKHSGSAKDTSLIMNHFQASKKLMNKAVFNSMRVRERIDLGFVDSDFVPLMCQENYLSSCTKKKMGFRQFRKVVMATDSFVTADIINRKIKRDQHYSLMPSSMFMDCVYPMHLVSETLGFPKFTSWLGKFSSQRKTKRLIKELTNTLHTHVNTTSSGIHKCIAPVLYETIIFRLKSEDLQETIKIMDNYGINPSHITEHLIGLQNSQAQASYKEIPTTIKTKLTKLYNQHHQVTKFKKGKVKSTEDYLKFDPVLQQFQNLRLQDDDEEDKQKEILVEKNQPKARKKKK